MENKPHFFEKQYFKQWWVWLLMIGLNVLFLYGVVTQVFMGITFGDKPMSDIGLIVFAVVFIAFTSFFFLQHLVTKIDDRGIYVKFWPYHKKWRLYTWEQIGSCELKTYNSLVEYGGWGLRQGAYNVSGNQGLLLKFKSGKPNLMIGTQKPEEIKIVLKKLNQL